MLSDTIISSTPLLYVDFSVLFTVHDNFFGCRSPRINSADCAILLLPANGYFRSRQDAERQINQTKEKYGTEHRKRTARAELKLSIPLLLTEKLTKSNDFVF